MSRLVRSNIGFLEGEALNWAVAIAIGHEPLGRGFAKPGLVVNVPDSHSLIFDPVSSAHQGWRLIKEYLVQITPPGPQMEWFDGFTQDQVCQWSALCLKPDANGRLSTCTFYHPTDPMIAALRSIVHTHHGQFVDIPEELSE